MGFDAVATGHHARVGHDDARPPGAACAARTGPRTSRTSSTCSSQDALARVRLPVGELTKAEVREHGAPARAPHRGQARRAWTSASSRRAARSAFLGARIARCAGRDRHDRRARWSASTPGSTRSRSGSGAGSASRSGSAGSSSTSTRRRAPSRSATRDDLLRDELPVRRLHCSRSPHRARDEAVLVQVRAHGEPFTGRWHGDRDRVRRAPAARRARPGDRALPRRRPPRRWHRRLTRRPRQWWTVMRRDGACSEELGRVDRGDQQRGACGRSRRRSGCGGRSRRRRRAGARVNRGRRRAGGRSPRPGGRWRGSAGPSPRMCSRGKRTGSVRVIGSAITKPAGTSTAQRRERRCSDLSRRKPRAATPRRGPRARGRAGRPRPAAGPAAMPAPTASTASGSTPRKSVGGTFSGKRSSSPYAAPCAQDRAKRRDRDEHDAEGRDGEGSHGGQRRRAAGHGREHCRD